MLALERRVRLPAIEPYLDPLGELADDGVPVFVTGDFNSPSHLDWTEEAAEARELPYSARVAGGEGPCRRRLSRLLPRRPPRPRRRSPGSPGPPGQPPPRIRPSETHDRIDWVLAAGPSETLSSDVVGEAGGPDVEVGVSPWGSDHRAVVSSFAVEPAPAPYLVSAEPRVVEAGARVTLRYTLAGGGPGRTVGIVAGRDPEGEAGADDPDLRRLRPHRADARHGRARARAATRRSLLDRGGKPLASSPFLDRRSRRAAGDRDHPRLVRARASRSGSAGKTPRPTSSTTSRSSRPATRASTATSASSTPARGPRAPSSSPGPTPAASPPAVTSPA